MLLWQSPAGKVLLTKQAESWVRTARREGGRDGAQDAHPPEDVAPQCWDDDNGRHALAHGQEMDAPTPMPTSRQ
jgi:hypothetical protein